MNENNPKVNPNSIEIERRVENWLTSIVINLNLCPFAQREYRNNSIRFKTSFAELEEEIVRDLVVELSLLNKHQELQTTLLILPSALSEFEYFNDFLGFADSLLEEMKLDGVFQFASFHPEYRFAGTSEDDAENFTNRAPYPMLHILRESSLDWAVDEHPDTDQIPLDNIALMNKLGVDHMRKMLLECSKADD
ncbi:MAG: hypothetical protein ACI9OI_001083 [Chitinophagales bacterium]